MVETVEEESDGTVKTSKERVLHNTFLRITSHLVTPVLISLEHAVISDPHIAKTLRSSSSAQSSIIRRRENRHRSFFPSIKFRSPLHRSPPSTVHAEISYVTSTNRIRRSPFDNRDCSL